MTFASARLAISLAILVVAAISTTAAQISQGDYVTVSGKSNPGVIPDYEAWRATFRMLARLDKGALKPIKDRLQFSLADSELIYKEARLQQARDDGCMARQTRVRDAMVSVKAESARLANSIDEVVLGCRQEVLDVSERLLAKLSADGHAILLGFLEERRANVEVLVHKKRMEFFRLPR